MKTNSARKTSPATPAIKPGRVINLDESQFAIYNTGKIDIVAPNGETVDVIGKTTEQLNKFGAHEEVANSLCLVSESLLGNQHGTELSPHAIAGLADLLSRAEGIIAR
jgi:hypothetical protein